MRFPKIRGFIRKLFPLLGRGYRIEAVTGHSLGLLQRIDRRTELIFMVGTETRKVLDALNVATNDVAAKIQTLVDGADLSPEEKAEFDSVVSRLQGLAANPDNPVPPA